MIERVSVHVIIFTRIPELKLLLLKRAPPYKANLRFRLCLHVSSSNKPKMDEGYMFCCRNRKSS